MATQWNAELYDAKHSFVWQQAAGLLELLAPRAGERILDLGSGTGHLTTQIAHSGATVVGLDSSPTMIDQARQAYPALEFIHGDARRLEFVAAFDAVLSNATLHWIPEADLVAQGIAHALKPGGRFVAEFGGKGNVDHVVRALQEVGKTITGRTLANPWYFPTVAEYAGVLERHSLEVTFATLFDRPTPLDGPDGMRDWIAMFGGPFLHQVRAKDRDGYVAVVLRHLQPALFQNGTWYADYRRLRVVASKQPLVSNGAGPVTPSR